MDDTTACHYGCSIPGHHTANCPGQECRGCLPRHTTRGLLCDGCISRIRDALDAIPELVDRLRVLGRPTAAARALSDDPHNRRDPSESIVLSPQWLDANELLSVVRGWAEVTQETHPQHPKPPKQDDLNPQPLVRWVLDRLDWITTQWWCVDPRYELMRFVREFDYKWPGPDGVQKPRVVEDVLCPRCHQIGTLVYYPAQWTGQAFRVECVNLDCRRIFGEDEWSRLVALAARDLRVSA